MASATICTDCADGTFYVALLSALGNAGLSASNNSNLANAAFLVSEAVQNLIGAIGANSDLACPGFAQCVGEFEISCGGGDD